MIPFNLHKKAFAVFCFCSIFSACIGVAPKKIVPVPTFPIPTAPIKIPFATLTERISTEALALEERGEYYKAYQKWSIIAALNPDKIGPEEAKGRMKKKADQSAAEHFNSGNYFLSKKSRSKARNEFVRTLAQDPTHKEAFDQLKKMMSTNNPINYKASKDRTPPEIAKELYNEEELSFLIAFFNGGDSSEKVFKGTELLLPQRKLILSLQKGKQELLPKITSTQKIGTLTSEASELYRKGEVGLAIEKWNTILALDSSHTTSAHNIKNATSLQNAIFMYTNKEYLEARKLATAALRNEVTGKDADKLLQDMYLEAEEYFKKGVKHFINDMIEPAVQNWAITLRLNPDHIQAREYWNRGKKLLQKLSSLK